MVPVSFVFALWVGPALALRGLPRGTFSDKESCDSISFASPAVYCGGSVCEASSNEGRQG